jgi:hypothetical protein
MLIRWFSPEVHLVATRLVLVVLTSHLVVRRLIGVPTNQPHTLGAARTFLKSEGSSMTRSSRVALSDPRGVSTILLTNPPSEPHTIFLRASTESQATKSSRRWQPPWVISTTSLQHDHLVPLDAISQSNRTRIAHSLNRMNTIKQEWVRGLSSTPTQATKAWGCSASSPWLANAWFYSPQENRAVIPLIGLSAYWRTHLQYDRTHPVAPISPRVPIVWKDLLAPKSYSYARSSSTNWTRPVNVAVASGACCNSVRCLLQRPVTTDRFQRVFFMTERVYLEVIGRARRPFARCCLAMCHVTLTGRGNSVPSASDHLLQ